MKAILILFIKIILFLNLGNAFANENSIQKERTLSPVMVIRYNKPQVYYDKPLEMLAKQAMSLKSEPSFTIETISAPNTSKKVDLYSEVQNIVNKLVEQNIKIEKIFITETADQNLMQNEIHIFVE
ncbi:MAG: hypothetical protein ACK4OM_02680 [Alphaproteobacteria bacterium]